MGQVKVDFGGKVADENHDYITRNSDGSYSCPCSYVIVKVDKNVWRCEGGGHEYRMDESEVIKNKMGEIMLKKKEEHIKEVKE